MILGIGIDLAEVSRVEQAVQGKGFFRRIYSDEERAACGPPLWNFPALAQAFALKEAFLKALGTGWSRGISFGEIDTSPLTTTSSPPTDTPIHLKGRAAEVARELGMTHIRAGVDHEGDGVMGWVILEADSAARSS